jgi:probable rRNA maturation factor
MNGSSAMPGKTRSKAHVEVQVASESPELPRRADIVAWATAALGAGAGPAGLVVRIVDEAESRELNLRYRGKDRPTNVLSFGFEPPPGIDTGHLGDLVVCAPVVAREAREQGKAAKDHWAHMVVHGVLHLRGHDHENAQDAQIMESLETDILAGFGIGDPYRAEHEAV